MEYFLYSIIAVLILLLFISPCLIVIAAAILLAAFVSNWFLWLLILLIPAIALTITLMHKFFNYNI